MNTFEDACRIAIEKHMIKSNREIESHTLHPLSLIKMIKNRKADEVAAVKDFSLNVEGRMGNNTSGVPG